MNNQNKQHKATILALTLSAMALLAAILFVGPSTATADLTIKDRDYQVVTAAAANGSDALFILDNRSGNIAVFMVDPGKGLQARQVTPVANVFSR